MIVAARLMERFEGHADDRMPRSNLKALPHVVNAIFTRVVEFETFLLRRMNLPWGSTVLAVARKIA